MPYLPIFIYELLPLAYAIFGLLALLNVEWMTGRVSGALLLLAAFLIWRMRRQYRAEVKKRRSAWRTKW